MGGQWKAGVRSVDVQWQVMEGWPSALPSALPSACSQSERHQHAITTLPSAAIIVLAIRAPSACNHHVAISGHQRARNPSAISMQSPVGRVGVHLQSSAIRAPSACNHQSGALGSICGGAPVPASGCMRPELRLKSTRRSLWKRASRECDGPTCRLSRRIGNQRQPVAIRRHQKQSHRRVAEGAR